MHLVFNVYSELKVSKTLPKLTQGHASRKSVYCFTFFILCFVRLLLSCAHV